MVAIGWLIGVGTKFIAKIESEWVGPEGWVNYGDVFFGDCFGIVFVLFIEAFFEGIIHGINGSFAVFVTLKSVEIGLLNKEEN